MKSRFKELLDRAVAATVVAIEIYNKPDFLYREEAFAVLDINGWELPLKAKWQMAGRQRQQGQLALRHEAAHEEASPSRNKLLPGQDDEFAGGSVGADFGFIHVFGIGGRGGEGAGAGGADGVLER